MIIPCTSSFDDVYKNMKSTGSGRGKTVELNGRSSFGPLLPVIQNVGQSGDTQPDCQKERPDLGSG